MSNKLRVLIVEDSEDDTLFVLRELRNYGYELEYKRVDNHMAMEDALDNEEWNIIISDYALPNFDGIKALKLMQSKGNDLPFILVSGAIGEDIAVKAMKTGANDYILKENLSRLSAAVNRELKEFDNRRKLKRMEEAIQALVKSTVVKTGQDAFHRITSGVQEWLGTDYVCLAQIVDDDKIKVLSINLNGELKCDCIFDIKGTLSDTVIKDGFSYLLDGGYKSLTIVCKHCSKIKVEGYFGIAIQNESGKNIGLLWTASHNKLYMPPRAKDVMEIIATKAASEIERMHAEEQIHKLSQAVEQSSSVVIITDTEGTIEYVNSMFTKVTGYTSEESIGQNPKILNSGKTHMDEYKRLWETIMHGKEWHGEFRNKKKNGDLYWEATSISPVRNKEGNITNFIAIKEDITERRKMEEAIRMHNEKLEILVGERTSRIMELERQRMENEKLAASGRMAATVAHEINNPLSAIKCGFMLIKDSITDDNKYYDYIGLIDKEIDRIARIVKQMFNLSRPYQGKICEFDAILVIRDVITMLDKPGSKKCVFKTFSGHDDIVKVTMSEDHFRQALYNIVKNAIEASHEGGKVEIRAKTLNDRLNIIVSDQGEGMSDDVRSKIFEPFFSTKSKYSDSGLGLGLSTTKVVVESMSGSVDCTSEKGKGTTFTIDLPINIIQ